MASRTTGSTCRPPDSDLRPGIVPSRGPEQGTFETEAPLFAQAAIGQADVAVTPLGMAMAAQAVANGGVMMVPHVLSHVTNSDGQEVPNSRYDVREYRRSMEPTTATTVRDLMVDVVNNGTGRGGQIPGIQVAGKTGTAQVAGEDPHAWFIGFAPAETRVRDLGARRERRRPRLGSHRWQGRGADRRGRVGRPAGGGVTACRGECV